MFCRFVAQNATAAAFTACPCRVSCRAIIPRNSILYNLEPRVRQIKEGKESISPSLRYQAENFTIWDYSQENLAFWTLAYPKNKAKYVPIGYAPVLERFEKPSVQDIDVLIYGSPNYDRLMVFKAVCDYGLKALFVCGLYGAERDHLISRSKVVLNIRKVDRIFEIVRVSYLLANRKAVIANHDQETMMESDIRPAVRLVPTEHMLDACIDLIRNDDARVQLEQTGYAIMAKRDIRTILQSALTE